MSKMTFKTTKRIDRPLMRIIHAVTDSPVYTLTIYLDDETGKPMYPISIERIVPRVTITLDSDDKASCSLPPCIPETMVDDIIGCLKESHDIISAARRLIKEEIQLFDRKEI